MRRVQVGCFVVLGLVLALFQSNARGQGDIAPIMRHKLKHSQKLLEGLAMEDFTSIAENATSLSRLSEKAEWRVLPSPEYVRYSSDFQRLTNELALAANKKNLDRATLIYTQLTVNCVDCHRHVRSARTSTASTQRSSK